jgi:site-specific recombinase XerD
MSRGVFERPKGSGVWWILYRDEHGRRHRERIGPKGLASKVYEKRKTEVAERRFFPEQIRRRDVPLADAISAYMRDHVVGRLRNAKHYAQYARRWTAALGTRPVRQIVPSELARYVARRQEDGKAPATINRELAFLKRLFTIAITDGLADTNPVKRIPFFTENNARIRYLTEEEEPRLHEEIGDEEWSKVAFAMHTGFRQGNQFALEWANGVNFDAGTITARKPKGGTDYTVPMNDTVRDLLRALPSRLKSRYVFPSSTGRTPMGSQNFLHRVFVPALRKAKIDDFHWHDLRHTFASRLVMAGVDLRTVQELMGHKTLAMTLRYAHLSPAHQRDAVRRLDACGKATRRATSEPAAQVAASGGAQVVDFPGESDGGGPDRTADLGIMRPSL